MIGKCREMSDYRWEVQPVSGNRETLQEFEDRDDKVIRPHDLL